MCNKIIVVVLIVQMVVLDLGVDANFHLDLLPGFY